MNDQIKSKVLFNSADDIPFSTEAVQIAQKQQFDADEIANFHPIEDPMEQEQQEGELEGLLLRGLKPKKSLWRKMVTLGISLLLISVLAQAGNWLIDSWQQQKWISLVAGIASTVIVLAAIGQIISEWHRLYRLRERAEERDIAKELLTSYGMEKGKNFCEKLYQQAGFAKTHPAVQNWYATIQQGSYNDREQIILYSKLVQPTLDEQAKKAISRYAAESTLMIAVSPLAIVDMAFIAWRNIKLINHIASIYGIELGYFSRIRLFRLVLLNIAFAGVTELLRETGMDWLSQDFLAKLSVRAAQGIGAGLLTARLGIKAMELCRPLPWIEQDKPQLSAFRTELFSQLKQVIPGLVTVKSDGNQTKNNNQK